MEDQQFYALYNFLNTSLTIIEDESGRMVNESIPYSQFTSYSYELASRFIGECNRNIIFNKNKLEFVLFELKNYKLKIEKRFKREFNVDYYTLEEDYTGLINKYRGREFEEEFAKVIHTKCGIYEMILNFLNSAISNNKTKHKSREKAVRESFKTKLKDKDLIEFGQSLVDERLIPKDTNVNDILSAFSGKRITNQIVWKGDAYSLALLIRSLNKKNCFEKKYHDGLWEIIVDIFKPNNRPYYEIKTLRNSSPTKNKEYNNIVYLVEDVENTLKHY